MWNQVTNLVTNPSEFYQVTNLLTKKPEWKSSAIVRVRVREESTDRARVSSNMRERNMVDCCVWNLDFQSWKKTRTNPEDWLLRTSL